METLLAFRQAFFSKIGEKRLYRILFCSLVIGIVWCFADWRSGNLTSSIIDDVLCLLLGSIGEQLIPWGKNPKEKG